MYIQIYNVIYIYICIYIHTCVTWEIMPWSMTWWEHATERWWWVPWTVCCCRMHWGISAYCSYQLLANSNVIIVHYQITSNNIKSDMMISMLYIYIRYYIILYSDVPQPLGWLPDCRWRLSFCWNVGSAGWKYYSCCQLRGEVRTRSVLAGLCSS